MRKPSDTLINVATFLNYEDGPEELLESARFIEKPGDFDLSTSPDDEDIEDACTLDVALVSKKLY